jgi:Tol biopolymer transport system component
LDVGDLRAIVWWHGGKDILYSSGSAIFRIAAGPNAERSRTKVMDGYFQDLAADRQGRRLAGVRGSSDPNIWRVGRNGEGRVKLIASSREESDGDYSPDGEWIVFRSTRSGNLELWVAGKDGSNPTRITNFGGALGSARWSPDGRQIAFDGWGPKFEHTKNTNIYVVAATGGPMRRLTDDQAIYGVPNWSHDGRWVYFMKRLGSGRETWKIPASGGTAVQVSRGMMFDVAESADGQYLYYTTQLEAGGIWRRRVDGGEPTLLRGTERVQRYRYWKLTPQGVYFVEGPADPVVQFLDFRTARVTRLASLSPQLLLQRGLSVSPDGRFFLYGQDDARQTDLYLIEGVQ